MADQKIDHGLWNHTKREEAINKTTKKLTIGEALNITLPTEAKKNVNIKPHKKKRPSMLSCSSSAHDLRHLEVEKDEESPRGVIESCLKDVDPHRSHEPELNCPSTRARSNWTRFFKLWKRKSIRRLGSLNPLSVPKLPKWNSKSSRENHVLRKIYSFRGSLVNFNLSDIQHATNNFSNENIIGRGGFAVVYKGRLRNGQFIAVKNLTKGTTEEKTTEFLSELGVIAHVDHPNTAKLIGCCVQEEKMQLIFELSQNGSLRSILHGPDRNKLDWRKRYKIALGIADGLLYLHECCQRRIIHRDIKAENILLTKNFEPQICDFGLAKWLPEEMTHHNIPASAGTFGYFAPEYFMHGIVDEKIDVFSFGVLLLEIITGRRALNSSQQSVLIWAKPILDPDHMKDLVDPSLGQDYDRDQVRCVILTASLCVDQCPAKRPSMSKVVAMLRGETHVLQSTRGSRRRPLQRTFSEELLDAQEYNSTKYLRELKRHRQVALEDC